MSKQNPIAVFRSASTKTKIKYGIASLLYVLFVIWLESPIWFVGLFVMFDLYITKWVKWAFWKKKYKAGEKRNLWLDWLDAIVFALIVASVVRIFFFEAYVIPSSSMEKSLLVGDYLFVSKIAYGPKIPNTPLSIPLVHNQITLFGKSMKSYTEMIKLPYRRLAGFGKVQRNDNVVFNYPNGDTIIVDHPEIIDYHATKASLGNKFSEWININKIKVQAHPMDKKDHYVKRCVAIPGDSLEVRHGQLFINGNPAQDYPDQEYSYTVVLKEALNPKVFSQLSISNDDVKNAEATYNGYRNLVLTQKAAEELKRLPSVASITRNERNHKTEFPYSSQYDWTTDNYGPLWIPKQGETVQLTVDNLCLYQRIITAYEHNSLKVDGEKIYINGEPTDTYTFAMDYYFMMGDNRHGSYDSRSWGFVPEDHIVGKPVMIWFSSNKDKQFPSNIRWERILNFIK